MTVIVDGLFCCISIQTAKAQEFADFENSCILAHKMIYTQLALSSMYQAL